jgi:hypothetical protein
MNKFWLLILFFSGSLLLKGQDGSQTLVGKVSFISAQNIYVRFKSTSGISAGDTLFVSSNERLIPVLKVTALSSSSCVCTSISGMALTPDHLIIARVKSTVAVKESADDKEALVVASGSVKEDSLKAGLQAGKASKQDIKGSISVNSYSDFSDTGLPDSYRFRYSLSLDARHIADSRFSFDTYVSFRHKAGEWDVVKSDIFNALKIFNLALKYDLNESTNFVLGRRINPRITSIGAIDGIQAEKSFGKISLGAIAGFRPDYETYGINTSLFQYGAYLGFDSKGTNGYSGNSVAFMQQMNGSATDRRFLYFQHSSSLFQKINFLSTFEIDLYKLENDQPKSTFDLTSLYLSMRYRMTRRLSVSAAYDTRKNVVYYETYKTYLDHVLETERRQGLRLQADYTINDWMIFGINAGYRLIKSDPLPSKNINGYLTFRQIPGMKLFTSTLSGTYIETAYVKGWIARLNLSHDLFDGKVQPVIGYSYVDYTLPDSNIKLRQNIAEVSLAANFSKTLLFAVSYEGTFESSAKYNRIYVQLRKRF